MFTFVFALAFSLAVVALIGVGVTKGFDWLVEFAKDSRERLARARIDRARLTRERAGQEG